MKNIIVIVLLLFFAGGFYLYKSSTGSQVSFIKPVVKIFSPTKVAPSYTPVLPTLDQIFADDRGWTATLSAEHMRTITATGDVIPARSVNAGVLKRNNPLWPYEKVIDTFTAKKADVVFVNLETPLLKDCPTTEIGMVFCGSDRNVEGLKAIGVTVASLANNHAGNHGKAGVAETMELLHKNGIETTGTNGALYKEIKGKTFAFLGFNDIEKLDNGVSLAVEEKIKSEIAAARQKVDVVIVTYHWGAEYRRLPDERQIALGHLTIDAGADLVIGNHPHWIQPVEIYKGKLITYAHGNFIFDQMWSEETKKGVIGWYTFYDNQLIAVEYLPIYIQDYGQASFLQGERKQKVLDDMKQASIDLANGKKE